MAPRSPTSAARRPTRATRTSTRQVAFFLVRPLLYLAPTSRREQFTWDAARLTPGMSAVDVEQIMAGHRKGSQFPIFAATEDPRQPREGETYYEPRGEHHSFDHYCRVIWGEDGRVREIVLHED